MLLYVNWKEHRVITEQVYNKLTELSDVDMEDFFENWYRYDKEYCNIYKILDCFMNDPDQAIKLKQSIQEQKAEFANYLRSKEWEPLEIEFTFGKLVSKESYDKFLSETNKKPSAFNF